LLVVHCIALEQVFGDGDCSTVSFKLSPDLIHWSESTVIRKCICEGGKWEVYPSLMDPRSERDSFDTVGKTALLFHVNLHGRQIWSYEVEFGGADEESDNDQAGDDVTKLVTAPNTQRLWREHGDEASLGAARDLRE